MIHNFSSGVGFTGLPGMTGYTSIKGAVESLTRTKSAAGLGVLQEMMASPEEVGRGLAKLVGRKNPMLTFGAMNNIQLWMRYHLRIQKGGLMSMMAEKARANRTKENP